jgi:branched-chain amino acid transport system permease protein
MPDLAVPLLQVVLNGMLLGGVYALVGLGLTLIFGIMDVVNLGHGALVTLGAYLGVVFVALTGRDPLWALPVVAALAFGVGVIIERLVIDPFIGGPLFVTAVGTFAVDLVIVTVILLVFSPTPVPLESAFATRLWRVGPLTLPVMRVVIAAVGTACAAGLAVYLARTRVGRSIRAVAADREAAALRGVDVRWTYALAFGLGSALTSVGGLLVATIHAVRPTMGYDFLVTAFIVAILGGLGNVWGALVAAYLYAFIVSVATFFAGAGWSPMVGVALLLAVLLVRPQGLAGLARRA